MNANTLYKHTQMHTVEFERNYPRMVCMLINIYTNILGWYTTIIEKSDIITYPIQNGSTIYFTSI